MEGYTTLKIAKQGVISDRKKNLIRISGNPSLQISSYINVIQFRNTDCSSIHGTSDLTLLKKDDGQLELLSLVGGLGKLRQGFLNCSDLLISWAKLP